MRTSEPPRKAARQTHADTGIVHTSGDGIGGGELTVLKDAHARATWIREQLGDGDVETARLALDDLAWDLWTAVERQESLS